jgi:hypothetical protein
MRAARGGELDPAGLSRLAAAGRLGQSLAGNDPLLGTFTRDAAGAHHKKGTALWHQPNHSRSVLSGLGIQAAYLGNADLSRLDRQALSNLSSRAGAVRSAFEDFDGLQKDLMGRPTGLFDPLSSVDGITPDLFAASIMGSVYGETLVGQRFIRDNQLSPLSASQTAAIRQQVIEQAVNTPIGALAKAADDAILRISTGAQELGSAGDRSLLEEIFEEARTSVHALNSKFEEKTKSE